MFDSSHDRKSVENRTPMGARLILYTHKACPQCMVVKHLLATHKYRYEEIKIEDDPSRHQAFLRDSGNSNRVPPQLFANGIHIGDYRDITRMITYDEFDEWIEDAVLEARAKRLQEKAERRRRAARAGVSYDAGQAG